MLAVLGQRRPCESALAVRIRRAWSAVPAVVRTPAAARRILTVNPSATKVFFVSFYDLVAQALRLHLARSELRSLTQGALREFGRSRDDPE